MTLPTLTTLRNWSHSLLPIIGVVGVGYGTVVNIIATSDPALNTKYANFILLVGGIITAVSKGIDSLNNALGGQPVVPPKLP
jgi:hypothetical protein